MLSWAIITPFGVPVVPDVKIRSQMASGRGRDQDATVSAQSRATVSSGSATRSATVVVGKAPSPTVVGSGASRPVPRMSRRGSAAATVPAIASALIRRSSGTRMRPARIAPK
jgi:hypothetical protein